MKDHALFVLKRLAQIEAAVIVGVGALCLVAGWHSVNEISLAYLAAGALIFSIGPFSMLGGWGTTRDFSYLYGRTLDESSTVHRAAQDRREINRNIGLILPSVLIGTITIILSVAIQVVFS